jgi:chromosome segregation ATPase
MSDVQSDYAELVRRRAGAGKRVEQLEAEQRAAAQARQQARAALVEAERTGARPAERAKAEKALVDAELKPGIIGAKIEGARAAVLDVDRERAAFAGEHLAELIAPLEEQGQLVKAKIDAACEAIVTGHAEREQIAGQMSALASMVGRVQPGDITRSKVEQLARQAADLLRADGEEPPRLRRDPRQPVHGEAAA